MDPFQATKNINQGIAKKSKGVEVQDINSESIFEWINTYNVIK